MTAWELEPLPARDEVKDEWMKFGACTTTDPEAFFPEKGESTRDAKRVCAGCDVKARCLAYALDRNERFGVWGGMSERARRTLRSERRAAA